MHSVVDGSEEGRVSRNQDRATSQENVSDAKTEKKELSTKRGVKVDEEFGSEKSFEKDLQVGPLNTCLNEKLVGESQSCDARPRRSFDVSIVNTSHLETDVDTPNASSSDETHSGFGSPPAEIRSERRLPPVGCSSEDPASSGSASDDLEKCCYDSLEEDNGQKRRLEAPKRRRALPAVPADYGEQQKRAFESLQQHALPTHYVSQPAVAPSSAYYVPFQSLDSYDRQHAGQHYFDDPWRPRSGFFETEPPKAAPTFFDESPIQPKVERSRTFHGPRRRRELPQVPAAAPEVVTRVDSPEELQRRSLDRDVIYPQREFRGNPPVPRWAHQGAGGFLQFPGEEDSGCASLDRSSVSPQQQQQQHQPPQPQQQQQQQQEEGVVEDRDACSFMWFDMTPALKKPEVVRRQKKAADGNSVAAAKKATHRHSAPPGSLDYPSHRQPPAKSSRTDARVTPADLKRRKSSTTLNSGAADHRRKSSQSRCTRRWSKKKLFGGQSFDIFY
jgi:hypothetical protein